MSNFLPDALPRAFGVSLALVALVLTGCMAGGGGGCGCPCTTAIGDCGAIESAAPEVEPGPVNEGDMVPPPIEDESVGVAEPEPVKPEGTAPEVDAPEIEVPETQPATEPAEPATPAEPEEPKEPEATTEPTEPTVDESTPETPQTKDGERLPFDAKVAGITFAPPAGYNPTRDRGALAIFGPGKVPAHVFFDAPHQRLMRASIEVPKYLEEIIKNVVVTDYAKDTTFAGYKAKLVEGTGFAEGFGMKWRAIVFEGKRVSVLVSIVPKILWRQNVAKVTRFENSVTKRK